MEYCNFCGDSARHQNDGINFCEVCLHKIGFFMNLMDGFLTEDHRTLFYNLAAEIIGKRYKNIRFCFSCYEDFIEIRGYLDSLDPDNVDDSEAGNYDEIDSYIIGGSVGFKDKQFKIQNLFIEHEYISDTIKKITTYPRNQEKKELDWNAVSKIIKSRFRHAPQKAMDLMEKIFNSKELPVEHMSSWSMSFNANNELPENMPNIDFTQADAIWILSNLSKYGGEIKYGDQISSIEPDPLQNTIFLFHIISERTYRALKNGLKNNFDRILASDGWAFIGRKITRTDVMLILCMESNFSRYFIGIFDYFTGTNILDRIRSGVPVYDVLGLYINGV